MDFYSYIEKIDTDYSNNRINEEDIDVIEISLGLKMGKQLKEYVLRYGYLGFKHIEFFGVNNLLGPRSNMVKQTLYLHKYFPVTKDLIALEDQGDGDYYLVDQSDNVFRFLSSRGELSAKNLKLFDYIISRFDSAK